MIPVRKLLFLPFFFLLTGLLTGCETTSYQKEKLKKTPSNDNMNWLDKEAPTKKLKTQQAHKTENTIFASNTGHFNPKIKELQTKDNLQNCNQEQLSIKDNMEEAKVQPIQSSLSKTALKPIKREEEKLQLQQKETDLTNKLQSQLKQSEHRKLQEDIQKFKTYPTIVNQEISLSEKVLENLTSLKKCKAFTEEDKQNIKQTASILLAANENEHDNLGSIELYTTTYLHLCQNLKRQWDQQKKDIEQEAQSLRTNLDKLLREDRKREVEQFIESTKNNEIEILNIQKRFKKFSRISKVIARNIATRQQQLLSEEQEIRKDMNFLTQVVCDEQTNLPIINNVNLALVQNYYKNVLRICRNFQQQLRIDLQEKASTLLEKIKYQVQASAWESIYRNIERIRNRSQQEMENLIAVLDRQLNFIDQISIKDNEKITQDCDPERIKQLQATLEDLAPLANQKKKITHQEEKITLNAMSFILLRNHFKTSNLLLQNFLQQAAFKEKIGKNNTLLEVYEKNWKIHDFQSAPLLPEHTIQSKLIFGKLFKKAADQMYSDKVEKEVEKKGS